MSEKTKTLKDTDLCVGIDLGTTNSVLAIINEKANGQIVSKVVDIPRADDIYNTVSGESKLSRSRKSTLASCVYYRQEKNYEPLVGEFAKKQYSIRPHLVAKSIKSQMGNPEVTGLSEDVPDKTPAKISARILKHMIGEASKINRKEIRHAVITVPANFDSAMCKATLDAAALAGIEVCNPDGTEKPILLSEPNAVIYDLINQISNGEISESVIDLSTEKTVLVFDLGGGTLDITIHKIKRRDDVGQILKVDEIATNRYTLLGGDDFDEEIAKEMYRRYIAQYSTHLEIVAKIRKEEKTVMAALRGYAENLKIELNERCQQNDEFASDWDNDYSSAWDLDDEDGHDDNGEIEIPVGGNVSYTGYSYDDTFTKTEIEKILSVFMADALVFEDYKDLRYITDTHNIIYPILDVLKKAA
ncbi:MAG: Hsp70 family protein, partial [Clostridia bacterium]|nr:Hsp70 family protein [Clostridia bacterium]